MLNIFDTEEAPEFIGLENGTATYHHLCPRCGSSYTFFSGKYDGWVCHSCGLVFSTELALIFNDIRQNELEEVSNEARAI